MFSLIRKHLCYANVTATLALVFAMSGGALAASHYLLSSTSQISPKVLKALKGKEGKQGPAGLAGSAGAIGAKGETGASGTTGSAGPAGLAGLAGPAGPKGEPGAAGAAGVPGSPWTADGTLPSGKTETGTWATNGPPETSEARVSLASFTIPLAAAPTANLVGLGEGEGEVHEKLPAGCKGNYAKPGASPGNFCVFEALEAGITELEMTPTTVGVIAHAEVNLEAEYNAAGTWAVTAK